MTRQAIGQWIKSYLEFAMPLIIIIVALNSADSIIYPMVSIRVTEFYHPPFDGIFKPNAHFCVFIHQVITGKVFLCSLIFMASALFLRLFTNSLRVNLHFPFYILWIYAALTAKNNISMVIIVLVDVYILFIICLVAFIQLKIFFAKCHFIIRNILYMAIVILGILVLFMNKFEMIDLSLTTSKDIFIGISCFTLISILCNIVFKWKTPQDISTYAIESVEKAEETIEARKEKREYNRIINDIADAVRRKL